MDSGQLLAAVVSGLEDADVQALLSNRGLPCSGPDAIERLQTALVREHCRWRWQKLQDPNLRPVTTVNGYMFSHGGCLYVFGGFDQHWQPHSSLWMLDPESICGCAFVPVACHGKVPRLLWNAGTLSCLHDDQLWVLLCGSGVKPACYQLDLRSLSWKQQDVTGPAPAQLCSFSRSACTLALDNSLLVLDPSDLRQGYSFHFQSLAWQRLHLSGPGEPDEGADCGTWSVSHLCSYQGVPMALGCCQQPAGSSSSFQLLQMDSARRRWKLVPVQGRAPQRLQHASSALVGRRWMIHGGVHDSGRSRVSNHTHVLDLEMLRWTRLVLATGYQARPRCCHSAAAIGENMMVVAGGGCPEAFSRHMVFCRDVELLHMEQQEPAGKPEGPARLLSYISTLLEHSWLADVELRVGVGCGQRTFLAHRIVLFPHSRVLEAMVESAEMCGEYRKVLLPEEDAASFSVLLSYMYGRLGCGGEGGQLPDELTQLLQVLTAAHRLEVAGLVKEVLSQLRCVLQDDHDTTPSSTQATELLLSAVESCPADSKQELLSLVAEVGLAKLPETLVSPGFLQLAHSHPDLARSFTNQALHNWGKRQDPGRGSPGGSSSSGGGGSSSDSYALGPLEKRLRLTDGTHATL